MNFHTIYPKDIERARKQYGAMVYDLRESWQYKEGHWPGAISYPYRGEKEWGKELSKTQMLILYCEHGASSMLAARNLGREYPTYTVIGGYEAMKKIQESYSKIDKNM